jgi:glycosyltransferase involved in cell wall biosynthesis
MPKLLTLENTYTMHTIRARRLVQDVLCTDLDGFFRHVWRVHPAVGADPTEPPDSSFGSPEVIPVSSGHSVIEGRVGRSPRLRAWPRLNFLLAQAGLVVRLSSLIRREEISVIRAGDPYYLGLLGLLLSRLHGIPLVVRVDANYDLIYRNVGDIAYPRLLRRRSLEKRIERVVLSRAELVAGGNQNNLDYALSSGARRDRATVFRVGTMIHPGHYADPAERGSVAGELGLNDRPFLAYVGRLEPLKYSQDVVHVLARCHAWEPRLAAVLAGDGSLRPELEALACELGVREHVIFVGFRDQTWLADMLASATIVVAPDGGRSLIEAALAATPVVAYDHEWHSELLSSGSTGLLVPFRDIDAMSAAVRQLLADREWASLLGTRGREAALTMMDPNRLIEHERQQYEKLLASGP